VEVAEILARERDTPRSMLPPSRSREAAEMTEPMPVVDTDTRYRNAGHGRPKRRTRGSADDRDDGEEYR